MVYLKAWDWMRASWERQTEGAERLGHRATLPAGGEGEDGEQARGTEGWPRRPGQHRKLLVYWKQVRKWRKNNQLCQMLKVSQIWRFENWASDLAGFVVSLGPKACLECVQERIGEEEYTHTCYPLCANDCSTVRNLKKSLIFPLKKYSIKLNIRLCLI